MLLFYASRRCRMCSDGAVMQAAAQLFQGGYGGFIAWSGAAIVLFRSELAMLCAATVAIDSLFWGRPNSTNHSGCLVFVLLYSCLPHKELDLCCTLCAAVEHPDCLALFLVTEGNPSLGAARVAVAAHLAANLAATGLMAWARLGTIPVDRGTTRSPRVSSSSCHIHIATLLLRLER
uniref:Rhomboid domain-containing protein n=1 Tax=Macrostomum lignano TaxID=282301 RepID=A0A1I8JPT9_9PLAT